MFAEPGPLPSTSSHVLVADELRGVLQTILYYIQYHVVLALALWHIFAHAPSVPELPTALPPAPL